MGNFFDCNLSHELRNTINSSPIFTCDKNEKKNFTFICTVMDRLDDSIRFLNTHSNLPQTSDDFLLFMVHACIVNDAVKEIMAKLNIEDATKDDKIFFKEICMSEPLFLSEDDCPTDSKFFEYFRSLTFAHPFETSRTPFLKENKEIHFAPFVLHGHNFIKYGCVGVMVYSNKNMETLPVCISFDVLKNYVNSRYMLISKAIDVLHAKIEQKNEIWKKHKVVEGNTPINTLKDIALILEERYEETSYISELIYIFEYVPKNEKTKNSLNILRQHIADKIPNMARSINELDHNLFYDTVDHILYAVPEKSYTGANYEISKILGFSPNSDDEQFFRICTDSFFQKIAKKWVEIDAHRMPVEEIKILVKVACYLEKESERATL